MEKLKKWDEAYEILQEMKPKHPERESIKKLTEVMRLYEKTIDLQKENILEMETSGKRELFGMTQEEIENKLSEVIAEKMMIDEYIEQEVRLQHAVDGDSGGRGIFVPQSKMVQFGPSQGATKPPDIPPEYFEDWETPRVDPAGWSDGNVDINPNDREHLKGWTTLGSQPQPGDEVDPVYKTIRMVEFSVASSFRETFSLAESMSRYGSFWRPVHKSNKKRGKRLILEPYLDMFFDVAEVFPQMFLFSNNHGRIVGLQYSGTPTANPAIELQREKALSIARKYAERCKSDASVKRLELYLTKDGVIPDVTMTITVGRGGWVDIASKEKIAWPRINTY